MRMYTVEGIHIYSGEVDWSTTVEAPDREEACRTARLICVDEIGATHAGLLDLTIFKTDAPDLDYKPK